MSWYQTLFDLIDMRSFSNLWYWLGLAVFWTRLGHSALGVPADMIRRAARGDDPLALPEVEAIAAAHARRLLGLAGQSGVVLAACLSFLFSTLLLLATAYRVEFAQAVLCFLVPALIVFLLALRTARLVAAGEGQGEALLLRLHRHRSMVQAIGMVSIFLTGLFGMYQNLVIGLYG